ncbi:MAG: RNA polymerase sigma factor [Clostridia bacterium]|nr:RNA polymerase sigma factor [Clostridia bacterium]
MDDQKIIALYWQRDEGAIHATEERYGDLLFSVARRILTDPQDSEEAVNDTYLKAWNAMPPNRPAALSAFLCRITRDLSVDRYRCRAAKKRLASQYTLSLEELAECVSDRETPEQAADLAQLAACISAFLRTRPATERQAFVSRYFFADSLGEIAARQDSTLSQVKSMLHRTRQSLRDYLQKEGFDV